ncbi:MAG: hypothetical protein AAF961_18465, partial [Planctomycetota bacterium]
VLKQTHPEKYRDGKDSIGDNGDGIRNHSDGLIAPDLNAEDDRDADAFEQIGLISGIAARDYNFGELASNVSKIDFIRPLYFR